MSENDLSDDPEEGPRHAVAVFSAATISGDADWPQVSRQVGAALAKANLDVIHVAPGGVVNVDLVVGLVNAGAEVTIISDGDLGEIKLPAEAEVEVIADKEARERRVCDHVHGFVGLPCSLLAMRELYNSWLHAGGGASGKPVALYNRNRAYEVLRGYTQDVLGHSLTNLERLMVFADSTDDLIKGLGRQLAHH